MPIFRQSTRCRPCRNAARRARRITFNGYVRVWMPEHPLASRHGYVLEHRLVLHDAGVHVPRGHDVHHRNGDKQDNRLENLELLPAGEHTRRHILERGTITNQYGTFPLRGALDTGNGVRA